MIDGGQQGGLGVAAAIEGIEIQARPEPVRPADRIFTLDMLRGWAVLGILAVNALAFAWPFAMQGDPTVTPPYPDSATNILGQWVVDIFFHDKFRSLFSMLFGVSIFLIGGERFDDARGPLLTRRLLWLLLIGVIHGAAFWYGDILLHYAYCGFLVMLMRSWSARRLILLGGGLNLAFAILAAGAGWAQAHFAGQAAAGQGGAPFAATPEALAAVIEAYQSGWPAAQIENLKAWAILQFASLFLIPVTMGLMLLGMGLYKAGFLAGRSPTWIYLTVAALGLANLAFFGWFGWMDAHAAPGEHPSGGLAAVGGAFAWVITLGYASLLILMTRFGLEFLTARLAPVGRMAFTNYLSQTLIMTTLFYMPWGPHWFGQTQWGPAGLWTLVGAIWIAQLIWSPLWLSRFQMGPLEWLWRRLTYGRSIPLLRRAD